MAVGRWKVFERELVDLPLTDLLPDMNGFELLAFPARNLRCELAAQASVLREMLAAEPVR